MPYLTIKPTEKDSIIEVGRLPIFSRRFSNRLNKDGILQIRTEGRLYAIEMRKQETLLDALDKAREQMAEYTTSYSNVETKAETKVDEKAEAELTKDLEDLGFVNLSPKKPTEQVKVKLCPSTPRQRRTPGIDYAGRPVKRGDLSLWEWLNKDDYIVNELFISESGRPLFEKVIDHDDISLVFINAGLPDNGPKNTRHKGKTAQNYANVVLAQLLRKGILHKEDDDGGKKKYSLSLAKGGAYARALHAIIQNGEYGWDSRCYRRYVKFD